MLLRVVELRLPFAVCPVSGLSISRELEEMVEVEEAWEQSGEEGVFQSQRSPGRQIS
jgi:hypothetical protein